MFFLVDDKPTELQKCYYASLKMKNTWFTNYLKNSASINQEKP